MEYTVILNDRSYDLPKKNIKVMEKLDEALKVDEVKKLPIRQKFEKLHRTVKDIIGEENAKEVFGSDNLDEIDTSDISLAVLKIDAAYKEPLLEYQREQMNVSVGSIPTEKIASIGKAVQTMASMQELVK